VQSGKDHNDPFNIAICHWNDLRADMKSGDELWLYSSQVKLGENVAGRDGIEAPLFHPLTEQKKPE